MKKTICLLLCVLFVLPTVFCAQAREKSADGTLSLIAYNVSGIPLVGDFQGSTFTTTNDRARRIGRLLNATGVDFIGTEEDFNGHKYLAAEMTNYPYRSYSSGGLAQGQGLNVFSPHPLYNVQRVKWDKEYGYLSGSMDAISNKGFIYCLMQLSDDLFIHVINVHMDAGYDPLSIKARVSNFRQLADFIETELDDGRAVIVQGDFNYKFKRLLKDDLYGNLLEPTGLRDVWAELENDGLYDQSAPGFKLNDPGDELDRILYRSGEDLELTPVSKTIPELKGEKGETYTDHNPMLTQFRYTRKSALPAPDALREPVAEKESVLALKEAGWTVVRFFQFLIGLVTELPYVIVQGIDLLINGKLP